MPTKIIIPISIAEAGSGNFKEWVTAILDTGAERGFFPLALLRKFGIDTNSIIGKTNIVSANGTEDTAYDVSIDLKIKTLRGTNYYLRRFPASANSSAVGPLIGMDILSCFEICIVQGKLIVMQLL